MTTTKRPPVLKCQYCGARNSSVSCHSGVDECQPCWYDRKMNRPAARHWAKAADAFTSNIDTWDSMSYVPSALAWYADKANEVCLSKDAEVKQLYRNAKRFAALEANMTKAPQPLTRTQMFTITTHTAFALLEFSKRYVDGTIRHAVKDGMYND